MAYEKYLKKVIEVLVDAERAQEIIDSKAYKTFEDLAEIYEDNSTVGFLRGEISAEQHRADLTAVKMLMDPPKIAAAGAPKWRKEVEKYEAHKGKRLPRTVRR